MRCSIRHSGASVCTTATGKMRTHCAIWLTHFSKLKIILAALVAMDRLPKMETPKPGSWFVRAICYDKLSRKADGRSRRHQ